MQVSETYSEEEEEKKTLSLITEVIVEPAHKSDTDALIPLIEATQKRGLGPEKALADALYGSDENCEKAKALGVEVVSPVMGKPPGKRPDPDRLYFDFRGHRQRLSPRTCSR